MEAKVKSRKFCLLELEDKIRQTYSAFKSFPTEDTRTKLFYAIYDMAYSIISVGGYPEVRNKKSEDLAYDYAIYLFERIITGKFEALPKTGDRFPWQQYIRLNVRHIIYTVNSDRSDEEYYEFLKDVEFMISKSDYWDDGEQILGDVRLDRKNLVEEVISLLKLFYTFDEIKRLFGISSLFLFNQKVVYADTPVDIKDFIAVFLSISKRVFNKYSHVYSSSRISDDDKKVDGIIRSSLFLGAICNTESFPRELILALGIESLFRLSQIVGGQVIRIPKQEELDTLIGISIMVAKSLKSGKDPEKLSLDVKNKMGLMFSKRMCMASFSEKLIESFKRNTDKKEFKQEPATVLETIVGSIGMLNDCLSDTLNKSQLFSSQVKDSLVRLRDTINNLLEANQFKVAGEKSHEICLQENEGSQRWTC